MRCWLKDGSVLEVESLTDLPDGDMSKLHREDGPSIVDDEFDSFMWFRDGKFHREDGPAFRDFVGGYHYYLNDKELTRLEHFKLSPHFQKLPESERLFEYLKISDADG